MSLETYLSTLRATAAAAEAAETAFRAEAEARSRALAAARAEAYRRMNFLTTLAETVAAAPDADTAVRTACAHLCVRLGWDEVTPARTEVLDHFAPVVRTIHASITGAAPDAPGEAAAGEAARGAMAAGDAAENPPPDASAAMQAFEQWYGSTRESTFWYLFEHYMPETPLVDF
ncbi:MAG: hypothetical protein B7X99_08905 [Rhizobiales bacterium 17-65-6]|nr:MAG: hypothetical protein B7Y84_18980 [Azorhizobium sp. 32-67-21]OYZ99215.1 MAG: hypothetical protein B7X99_08905 [Rhizobiales bacterium 17-65-6]